MISKLQSMGIVTNDSSIPIRIFKYFRGYVSFYWIEDNIQWVFRYFLQFRQFGKHIWK